VEFISGKEIEKELKVSRATLYRMVRTGFPRPIKIGSASRWSRRAVEKWKAEQLAAVNA
jgi:excisionase family DNA binding protein